MKLQFHREIFYVLKCKKSLHKITKKVQNQFTQRHRDFPKSRFWENKKNADKAVVDTFLRSQKFSQKWRKFPKFAFLGKISRFWEDLILHSNAFVIHQNCINIQKEDQMLCRKRITKDAAKSCPYQNLRMSAISTAISKNHIY